MANSISFFTGHSFFSGMHFWFFFINSPGLVAVFFSCHCCEAGSRDLTAVLQMCWCCCFFIPIFSCLLFSFPLFPCCFNFCCFSCWCCLLCCFCLFPCLLLLHSLCFSFLHFKCISAMSAAVCASPFAEPFLSDLQSTFRRLLHNKFLFNTNILCFHSKCKKLQYEEDFT